MTNGGTKVGIIWCTSDFAGSPVELTTDTMRHIHMARGEVIPNLETMIKTTIETPQMVIQSDQFDDMRIYSKYAAAGANILYGKYMGQWLHVPVSFQIGFGKVTTAYFGPTLKPGTVIYVDIERRL